MKACMETRRVPDPGFKKISQTPYTTAQINCHKADPLYDIKTKIEIPTRISTALARILANQYRGRTANIRHLLSIINSKPN
ncbi:MAG: hypothetical protein NVSMB46_09350 [Candidatus Saccharimonadales bacterium]